MTWDVTTLALFRPAPSLLQRLFSHSRVHCLTRTGIGNAWDGKSCMKLKDSLFRGSKWHVLMARESNKLPSHTGTCFSAPSVRVKLPRQLRPRVRMGLAKHLTKLHLSNLTLLPCALHRYGAMLLFARYQNTVHAKDTEPQHSCWRKQIPTGRMQAVGPRAVS